MKFLKKNMKWAALLLVIGGGVLFFGAKERPKVSIVSSVFKGDQFIDGFLKDITQQTIFEQCELILINPNSPGNEEPTIKAYMAKHPNIRYLKLEKDPGLYAVWNIGIEMAKAPYICNGNIDDRSDVEALEILSKELDEHPEIDLVYTDYFETYIPNETFKHNRAIKHAVAPEFSKKNMIYCLPGPRPVWRKSLHKRFGMFDETFAYSGDLEMWLRAVDKGAQFKRIARPLTLYYHNPIGLSTDMDNEKIRHRHHESERIHQKYGHVTQ
jgi:glycosyltransferase involved in cell wall biosynthesis